MPASFPLLFALSSLTPPSSLMPRPQPGSSLHGPASLVSKLRRFPSPEGLPYLRSCLRCSQAPCRSPQSLRLLPLSWSAKNRPVLKTVQSSLPSGCSCLDCNRSSLTPLPASFLHPSVSLPTVAEFISLKFTSVVRSSLIGGSPQCRHWWVEVRPVGSGFCLLHPWQLCISSHPLCAWISEYISS